MCVCVGWVGCLWEREKESERRVKGERERVCVCSEKPPNVTRQWQIPFGVQNKTKKKQLKILKNYYENLNYLKKLLKIHKKTLWCFSVLFILSILWKSIWILLLPRQQQQQQQQQHQHQELLLKYFWRKNMKWAFGEISSGNCKVKRKKSGKGIFNGKKVMKLSVNGNCVTSLETHWYYLWQK